LSWPEAAGEDIDAELYTGILQNLLRLRFRRVGLINTLGDVNVTKHAFELRRKTAAALISKLLDHELLGIV